MTFSVTSSSEEGEESVRKLKIGQSEPQNIETDSMNNNKIMRCENLKMEFSDSLGEKGNLFNEQ